MSKPAAIPIFGDAYLADTTHLTTEEHGAYFLLLLAAWRQPDCGLPLDDSKLARVAGMTLRKWKVIKDTILEFWKVQGDRIYQPRLLKEFEYACKKSETNRKSIAARWAPKNEPTDTPTDTPNDTRVDQKSHSLLKTEVGVCDEQPIENKQSGSYERIYERNTPPPPPIESSVNLEVSSITSTLGQELNVDADFENSKSAESDNLQSEISPSDPNAESEPQSAVSKFLKELDQKSKSPPPAFALTGQMTMRAMVDDLLERWNVGAEERGWRQVRLPINVKTERYTNLVKRIEELGYDVFLEAMRRAYNAKMFLEQHDADGPPGWFHFDWLIKNNKNLTDILEGKYDESFKSYHGKAANAGLTRRIASVHDVFAIIDDGEFREVDPMGFSEQPSEYRLTGPQR